MDGSWLGRHPGLDPGQDDGVLDIQQPCPVILEATKEQSRIHVQIGSEPETISSASGWIDPGLVVTLDLIQGRMTGPSSLQPDEWIPACAGMTA